jgi:hypothetical protein
MPIIRTSDNTLYWASSFVANILKRRKVEYVGKNGYTKFEANTFTKYKSCERIIHEDAAYAPHRCCYFVRVDRSLELIKSKKCVVREDNEKNDLDDTTDIDNDSEYTIEEKIVKSEDNIDHDNMNETKRLIFQNSSAAVEKFKNSEELQSVCNILTQLSFEGYGNDSQFPKKRKFFNDVF